MTDPQIEENNEVEKEMTEDNVTEINTENNEDGPTLDEALQQIATLDKELAESKDKMLRALAEAENTRRRAERERQDMAKFSVAGFAKDLLSVSDNLRRALDAVTEEDLAKNEQLKAIYEGVAATERELLRVFDSKHIKKIEPMDQKFDPNFHEVMFEAPVPGKISGTIFQIIEPGYMIHERLLRPARVGVVKNLDDDNANESGSIVDEEI